MNLAALACLAAAPLFAQGTGAIAGRVTNSVTGEGVGGVEIRFLDRHDHVFKGSTDASGAYRLTGLADGDYRGEFAKDGFANNSGNPAVHVAGTIAARQDAQLEPWSSLSGRVLDEDGNPAAKIEVKIGRSNVVTDDKGGFTFTSLQAGSYMLLAKPQPKIRTVEEVRMGTVAIYYPSATELSQAVPVMVRRGADVSGIELRLRSVPVHRVTGVVYAPSGKPVASASVKLLGKAGTVRQSQSISMNLNVSRPIMSSMNAGPGAEPEIARVESREDGTFEFPAVQPGDWRLSATLGEEDEMPLGGVASALVSVRDVEGIELHLAPSFAVGVTWQWPDTQAPSDLARNARVALMLGPVEQQPRVFPAPEKDIGQVSGVFPGRYRVLPFSFPRGYYPAAVMWGGRDVNGQVVELAPGAPAFEVIYRSGVGTLRGTVEKGEGGVVILAPSDPGEFTTIRVEPCGTGGTFEFANVVPGSYYVVAFDRSDPRGLPAAEIPSSIVPIATGVRVESGATASVELRLNRWPW